MYTSYASPSSIPSNLSPGAPGRQTYGYRPTQPSPYGQALPPGIRPPPGPPPPQNYVSQLPPGVKPPAGPPPPQNYVGKQAPAAAPQRPKVVHTEEIKLFENTREREEHDNNAELYAIIVATEHLEKAFVRGIVSDKDYSAACVKLIGQYRTALSLVKDSEEFIKTYNLNVDCKAGMARLTAGIPATSEHQTGGADDAKTVAEIVQHFITSMDSIRLNMNTVDALLPCLTDLLDSLNRLQKLSPDFEGKVKIKAWITKLNTMKASDELSEDDTRQLLMELDSSYSAFHKTLSQ